MRIRPLHAFFGGIAVTALVAAARFTGGTPVDQTFTYQGQLRSSGQLVNGIADLKISLWDADVGGAQIGSANTFNALQLADGRFACGLNFGSAAFDGSNRWIQLEFRNPAGTGQYLTLSPRDKITATPYALYALNGTNGVWVYNTNQQSVTVTGKRVGIGTSNPTATLEVANELGGDDSVKLPTGSVGPSELWGYSRSWSLNGGAVSFQTDVPGSLLLIGDAGCEGASIEVDGVMYGFAPTSTSTVARSSALNEVIPLSPGKHSATLIGGAGGCPRTALCVWLPRVP
jgi:hypothetical protein